MITLKLVGENNRLKTYVEFDHSLS